jgi:hypothetical protein
LIDKNYNIQIEEYQVIPSKNKESDKIELDESPEISKKEDVSINNNCDDDPSIVNTNKPFQSNNNKTANTNKNLPNNIFEPIIILDNDGKNNNEIVCQNLKKNEKIQGASSEKISIIIVI